MTRKLITLSLLLALILSLCSCSALKFDNDTLLAPPQMNAADREILKTLDGLSSSYKLVYPSSGSYQTAVTTVDITGDDNNEAVCFYTESGSGTVSFAILKNSDSKWNVIGRGGSKATAVDRVSFCDLDGNGIKEIIIGWKFLSGEENAIEVFGLGNTDEAKSLYTGMYNSFLTFDDCVVIISRNTASGQTASVSVLGSSNNAVSVIGTVSLSNSISSFIKVQSGQLSDSRRTVYIDEQLENLSYTTEVLTIGAKGELSSSPDELKAQSTRVRAYTCTDVNGDGRPDIPVERPFPSYMRNNVSENLAYVEWYDYDGNEMKLISNAYTSINEQYLIKLPAEWIGKITAQRDADTERLIHFFYTGDGTQPMFSMRVFSQQEFSESASSLGWKMIADSNENVYAFRNDTQGNIPAAFKTDENRMAELFKLIS